PDESMTVRIEFVPARLGPFEAAVQVTPCPTCAPRVVALTGRGVERLIEVQPASIDFGEVPLGEEATRPFSVTNTSRKPLIVQGFVSALDTDLGTSLDNASTPLTLAPGQTAAGTARFRPRATGRQDLAVSMPVSDGAPGALSLRG